MSESVVNSEIYDQMIKAATNLVNFIYEKQDNEDKITQEEADFANSFMAYAKEVLRVIEYDTN